ncbi:MAG: pyrroline-5-carboxylate reductase [Pseudomonadota bacterium]
MGKPISVALVGAGSMGGAMLEGWLKAGVIDPPASAIFDPKPPVRMRSLAKSAGVSLNPDRPRRFDVLILAVKPQIVADALPAHENIAGGAIVISVMAGVTIKTIAGLLGGPAKIARAMPNLPAAIAKGVTGVFANEGLTSADRNSVDALLAAVGETLWVGSEADIDLVTAVSGSGPAYFFQFAECLAEAARANGLPADAAMRLARATLIGAGAYAESDDRALSDIRKAVTSPGGTTEAGLAALGAGNGDLGALVRRAVDAARKRADDLSS